MTLLTYKKKRTSATPEPKGSKKEHKDKSTLIFVVQKHAARRLHYDFRLELDGVLKSWAIPKEPLLDPKVKRLAIEVEDHPYDYAKFEGTIPAGNYGAGKVEIWDKGTYTPSKSFSSKKEAEKILRQEIDKGHLKFILHGEKLRGEFSLVRIKSEDKKNEWLFIKVQDTFSSEAKTLEDDSSENFSLPKKGVATAPKHIKPMLATLVDKPFDKENWLFEIKWDGYRAIADIKKKEISLYSRNFLPFEQKFSALVEALKKLYLDQAVLDGEVVFIDADGKPSFQLLQNYLRSGSKQGSLVYYVFDLLFFNGTDLRKLPLIERKTILKAILEKSPQSQIIYCDHVLSQGEAFFEEAKKRGLEGIIAKECESPYISERSKNWLKIKTEKSQEAIIIGYTEPKGSRKHFGALILGVYIAGKLTYIGHTGTGFNEISLKEISLLMEPLKKKSAPVANYPKMSNHPTWLAPKLVCEVSFREWTADGQMRQPVFKGLRIDKKSSEIGLEKPFSVNLKEKNSLEKSVKKNSLGTNLQKVFWPEDHYTKGDLLEYYQKVAKYLLPHLKDRPLMLHRFPNGIGETSFFQKNVEQHSLPVGLESAVIEHSSKNISYLLANNLESLLYVVNLGTIDIHPFLSRYQSVHYPDFLVLDLDPNDLPFGTAVEVALAAHELLTNLDIEHFCKTSGKRGLHIYIPLAAKFDFQTSESFAKILAHLINKQLPELTSIERNPQKRPKRVYIDFLQNGFTKTVVAPYAVRALTHAPVATPLDWKEVKVGLDPLAFTIKTVPKRLEKKGDLFASIFNKGIDIAKAIKKIEKL